MTHFQLSNRTKNTIRLKTWANSDQALLLHQAKMQSSAFYLREELKLNEPYIEKHDMILKRLITQRGLSDWFF